MGSKVNIALFIALLATANTAHALWGAVAGTIGGSVLVKQAGDKLEDAVARSEVAGLRLIAETNTAAEQRLGQIDKIVDDALLDIKAMEVYAEEAVIRIIENATSDVLKIEKVLMDDISLVLWKAECGLKRVVLEDAKEFLGDVGKVLNTHRIVITAPIEYENVSMVRKLCFWCDKPNEKTFEMTTPFGKTYKEIREYMLNNLDDNLTLDTPVHRIVDTYEYLSKLARKTTCFYDETSSTYNREYIQYLSEAKKYTKILTPQVN